MINHRNIRELWLAACPSFAPLWAESCAAHDDALNYVRAGELARHLLMLHRSQQLEEFAAVAIFFERLQTEGDEETREFAAIGFLEAIQNVWTAADVPPEEFLMHLHPVSRDAWHDLNQFWGTAP